MKKISTAFSITLFSLSVYAETPSTNIPVANLPIDLSPQALYQNAHPIVQGVIIILLLCSVITWAIFFIKTHQLFRHNRALKLAIKPIQQGESLIQMYSNPTAYPLVIQQLLLEISQEISASQNHIDEDLKQRIAQRLQRFCHQTTQQMRTGVSILASIGAVAPFIGLFGTVWGIMNSFIGIAQTRSTDLYAVAPGIAEALFATALGLIAAIPAVVLYNFFNRVLLQYSGRLNYAQTLLQLSVTRAISLQQLPRF